MGISFVKCLINLKIFPYIDIREFAKSGVKPDYISTPTFFYIFVDYIIHVYIISINSMISENIVPIIVIYLGF